jgi:hypothetical protein
MKPKQCINYGILLLASADESFYKNYAIYGILMMSLP